MNNYLQVASIVFIYYIILFLVGQLKKNNSIIDIFWGLGFVIAAFYAVIANSSYSLTSLILLTLVSIWGLRLTYHIWKRNRGKAEDFRYVNFRKQWGNRWVKTKAFLHVYMLQYLMMLLISCAYINVILKNPDKLNYYVLIGSIIWIIGFYFEARSDYQLKNFKLDPDNKGKIMTSGLFKYSRHPNYFGEATMWWGIYVIGLSVGGYIYIISPITITILVRYISGVPMLEKHYDGNKAFEEYAKKTSIFIPLLPRK